MLKDFGLKEVSVDNYLFDVLWSDFVLHVIVSIVGTHVTEFCPHGTRSDCMEGHVCEKLHFKKIIQTHTDETLGDCSFLNTCFHMDTCK